MDTVWKVCLVKWLRMGTKLTVKGYGNMRKTVYSIICLMMCFLLLAPSLPAFADGEGTEAFDNAVRLSLAFDKVRYRPGEDAVLTVSALGLDDERNAGLRLIDLQTYIRFSDAMVQSCVPEMNAALSEKIANESEKGFYVTNLYTDVLGLYFYSYEGVDLQGLADEEGRLVLGTVTFSLKNLTGTIFAEFAQRDENGMYDYAHLAERSQADTALPKTMECTVGSRVEAAVRTTGRNKIDVPDRVENLVNPDVPKTDIPDVPIDPDSKFEDLDDYQWAQDAIYELRDRGIITGVSSTEFAPQKPITRGDFVLILSRMLGLEGPADDNFPDVPKDSYYYTAIGRAKAAGIALGYGVDFKPERVVNRQELITLAYRAFLRYGYIQEAANTRALEDFLDRESIHEYARVPIASMISADIIEGAFGMIHPLDNATRAEAAVMCARLNRLIEKAEAQADK